MLDIRAQLLRSASVPETHRKSTRYAVVHWNGPTVYHKGVYPGDVETLKADARWHVNNNGWDGLSYHLAMGRSGQQYHCRTLTAKLAHSGNSLMNAEAYSVLVITGDGDPISDPQYDALLDALRKLGINRRFWLGHKEAPRSTSCPGALLMRWLTARRLEVHIPVTNVKVLYPGTIRDESSSQSFKLGTVSPKELLNGCWRLGQPVKGDSLWLELSGDRYVHASALDSTSYTYVG